MAIAEANPKKEEKGTRSVTEARTALNYKVGSTSAPNRLTYYTLKAFRFDVPWPEKDIIIFFNCCKKHIEDLKNHKNDIKWRNIAKSVASLSSNPSFNVNECMELAKSVHNYISQNNDILQENEVFKQLCEDVKEILPYFLTSDSKSTNQGRSKVPNLLDTNDLITLSDLENCISSTVKQHLRLVTKADAAYGWKLISKKVSEETKLDIDVLKHLETVKSNIINQVNLESDQNNREIKFVKLTKQYYLEVFDYVPPKSVKTSDFLSSGIGYFVDCQHSTRLGDNASKKSQNIMRGKKRKLMKDDQEVPVVGEEVPGDLLPPEESSVSAKNSNEDHEVLSNKSLQDDINQDLGTETRKTDAKILTEIVDSVSRRPRNLNEKPYQTKKGIGNGKRVSRGVQDVMDQLNDNHDDAGSNTAIDNVAIVEESKPVAPVRGKRKTTEEQSENVTSLITTKPAKESTECNLKTSKSEEVSEIPSSESQKDPQQALTLVKNSNVQNISDKKEGKPVRRNSKNPTTLTSLLHKMNPRSTEPQVANNTENCGKQVENKEITMQCKEKDESNVKPKVRRVKKVKEMKGAFLMGWMDEDIFIFVQCCNNNITDLKNGGVKKWCTVAESCSRLSKNPECFTPENCSILGLALQDYLQKRKPVIYQPGKDKLKKLYEASVDVIPYLGINQNPITDFATQENTENLKRVEDIPNEGTTNENTSSKNMSTDNMSTVNMSTENNTSANKSTENIFTENIFTEYESTENKSTENMSTENKSTENKSTENNSTEDKSTENKSTENKSTENKSTENKSTENKSTESKSTENKSTENKSIENTSSQNTSQETETNVKPRKPRGRPKKGASQTQRNPVNLSPMSTRQKKNTENSLTKPITESKSTPSLEQSVMDEMFKRGPYVLLEKFDPKTIQEMSHSSEEPPHKKTKSKIKTSPKAIRDNERVKKLVQRVKEVNQAPKVSPRKRSQVKTLDDKTESAPQTKYKQVSPRNKKTRLQIDHEIVHLSPVRERPKSTKVSSLKNIRRHEDEMDDYDSSPTQEIGLETRLKPPRYTKNNYETQHSSPTTDSPRYFSSEEYASYGRRKSLPLNHQESRRYRERPRVKTVHFMEEPQFVKDEVMNYQNRQERLESSRTIDNDIVGPSCSRRDYSTELCRSRRLPYSEPSTSLMKFTHTDTDIEVINIDSDEEDYPQPGLSRAPIWFRYFASEYQKHEQWKILKLKRMQEKNAALEKQKIDLLNGILNKLNNLRAE